MKKLMQGVKVIAEAPLFTWVEQLQAWSDGQGTAYSDPGKAFAVLDVETIVRTIDADTDAIYAAAIGNRGPEYTDAEKDAQAFTDAAYQGPVPPSVQVWATAKRQTAQWAAQDILVSAGAMRQAKEAIRENRLARKEEARTATTPAEADLALLKWKTFLKQICTALNIPQL